MPDRITFTGPDGGFLDLTDEGVGLRVLAEGTRGLRSPAYRLATSRQAGIDGARLDAITADEADMALGLLVRADSEDQLRARVQNLVHVTRPKAGDGVLRVQRPDGTGRELTCRIVDGLAGNEDKGTSAPGRWWRALLKVWAGDPWWYGDQVTIGFGLAAPSVFLSPTLPMPRALSSSSIQGQQDVDVQLADDEVRGVWTVTGPGNGLLLRRELLLPDGVTVDPRPGATRVWQSSVAIPDGGTVVLDTRRGFQSFRRGDGTRLMSTVIGEPRAWALTDGRRNRVSVLLGDAGAGANVQYAYRPKFGGI
ncbi:hypothetical protein [Klenkia brasiliensis]|uniref:Uncharacterized protein n=1 Tax=Klenkia brasiliensis TaxID=333142 RepID=A0A1G7YEQ7_9ACTN|nr:hypothetical protein [Klenkia brasiliensis]SDG95021.1 hypothetical protein SAMN05660324_3932 [Klenkia brasiliensis]